MKCLSLWEPWATLMVFGFKKNETRSWPTGFRGPLLIHASKRWTSEQADLCREEPFRSRLHPEFVAQGMSDTRGCIIGQVFVVDVVRTDEMAHPGWEEARFGDYSYGRFAWVSANQIAFGEPIPYRGRQGLFEVAEPDIIDRVKEELRNA